MPNIKLKPGPTASHFKGFPNNAREAAEQKRTYYLDASSRCRACGMIGRWTGNQKCMQCFDINGERR